MTVRKKRFKVPENKQKGGIRKFRQLKAVENVTNNTPEITHITTNEPILPTIHEFISAYSTDLYCDKF